MRRVIPRDVETAFECNEMFFSRTDSKGILVEVNEVFVRISGYSQDELLGKPHNWIRHPDMPRALFKILWDTLKRGESIAAYVKNLSADGSNYWVLASVFPSDAGYISIRIKPHSPFLAQIKTLYGQMLEVEKNNTIEASEKFLMDALSKQHFDSYQKFAIKAAEAELDVRRQLMNESEGAGSDSLMKALHSFQKINTDLSVLCELKDKIEKIGNSMRENYQIIKYVGVNMHIGAEHLGDKAVTIGVIAKTFQTWAYDVFLYASETTEAVTNMVKAIDSSAFLIANSRFKIEMIAFEKSLAIEESLKASRMKVFGGFSLESLVDIRKEVSTILSYGHSVESTIAKLREAISALHIIRQNGRIEMASMALESDTLHSEFNEMKNFIEIVTSESRELSTFLNEMLRILISIQMQCSDVEALLRTALRSQAV